MSTSTATPTRPDITAVAAPSREDLDRLFLMKYGDPRTTGPANRRRLRWGYYTPDDVYEALVASLVHEGTAWLDVGGGRHLFPGNTPLADQLARRARLLVGVDPDDNIFDNPWLHQKVKCPIEDYQAPEPFDLLTLRMVAEHITAPRAAVASMARLVKPGGRVVVYTVNQWSPASLAAWVVPHRLHHPIKRLLWGGEERDTFPVAYQMNTRRALRRLFAAEGLQERLFEYLDDCRTFYRFPALSTCELALRHLLAKTGVHYPENCLLGVYEKASGPGPMPRK
jgi:SAM-dependent methyltransferase